MGWMFGFQTQNEKWNDPPIVWNTYNQVIETLEKLTVKSSEYVILDEYDEVISLPEFCEMVERKQEDCKDNPDNFTYSRNVDGYRFIDTEFS